ncbi:TonB family protein [Hymenobacter arizonensis]|uniref:TonB family C-terminal domain-containing protein n=1 Tax=Hymenobacter arizonensis TaxID=1227077 RepID=A0A1I5X8P1_HYMAR|nr:TonB family protein [Hymenobacter arizonensis]SFQ28330.1 TonB family C-terminal domain-containing protein [Hymenobacter arizonensis]
MLPADSPFAPLPAPGPHPATEELRAYAAGTLAPSEQHRIEAHTLDCERCADLVDGFSMSDAATTDQAVTALRTRLHGRIGIPAPGPAGTRWAWPRLAAAAALLGAVATGVWTWEQRPPTGPTARIETAQPMVAKEPAPVAETAPTAHPPEVAAASTPEKQQAADYAVATPTKRTRLATPRAAQRSRPARKAPSERIAAPIASDLADLATTQQAVTVLEEAPAPPAVANTAIEDSKGTLAAKSVAADTIFARPKAVAGRVAMTQARALAATDKATGWATAAPMPVSPSIKPAPVGGSPALRDYIRREASTFEPESGARRLQGTVRVSFVVEADGKLSNLKVTRGLRDDYDAEALRIVCEGPTWQPGVSGGRRSPLPTEVNVPF